MCQSQWNWEMELVSSGYQHPGNVGRKRVRSKQGRMDLLKIFINYPEIHTGENFVVD